jgi:hypothetical protein
MPPKKQETKIEEPPKKINKGNKSHHLDQNDKKGNKSQAKLEEPKKSTKELI